MSRLRGDALLEILDAQSREEYPELRITAGPYSGALAPQFLSEEFVAALAELPALLASPLARVVADGRNRHVCIDMPVNGTTRTIIVKAFGRLSLVRDLRDRRRGSRARRTWLAATHLERLGVGTPQPVGYVERWDGWRLRESYYLAVYDAQAESFRDALLALFHETPECARFMDLLECVAAGVRDMHDAGFLHNDLGNQNVLLTRDGPARWRDFRVIDLNRGRLRSALSLRERARDLSRLHLPSHLLWWFINMYWRDVPPAALFRWERAYRKLYGLHSRSRRWRHPIREARRRRQTGAEPAEREYPAPRDAWIWDERSGQTIPALLRAERLQEYPVARLTRMAADTLRAAPGVWREYRALLGNAFRQPVNFAGRIGMALNPAPDTFDRELQLLDGLGRIPAFVRFYHHEALDARRFRARSVHALHHAGHPVSIALVQDRRAVRDPAAWHDFMEDVIGALADVVEEVEVGHNVNRAKWGVWEFRELRQLYAPLPALRARFPALRFTGPAAIDFEYPFLLSALREWPANVPLSALSHHLYVDRRGAPENSQGGYGALEKFALARAIARRAPACADRLIVTEVNWPLRGQGAYSPIGAPHALPWLESGDGGVTEEAYGDYMIRYLCCALGSGMVDRVYWWRLVARGFGLVDDTDSAGWRLRPAYEMLRAFLRLLGDSTLVGTRSPPRVGARHGRYRFEFRRPDGESVVLTYAHGPALPFPADEPFTHVEDGLGRLLERPPVHLTGRPVYLRSR